MAWWRGAVVYQVYPRSFLDTDGDGIGDLKGVEARLDYIAGLGVDAVWLSPTFRSPMRDFGYDVSDYCDIDPLFGTLADFDRLAAAVHARGLKLILDQVWSHTSDQHPWFQASRASRAGDKADWYVWADPKPDGSAPNNWISVFGGPAWAWDERRGQYYLHNFLAEQPDLNFHSPAVQDAVLEAARFWLERGVDGFRLDVVNYYAHDRLLRDNPPREGGPSPYRNQRHLYDCSQPETLAFLAQLRRLLDRYGAVGLGEIFDDEPLERQREYTEGADRLHTAYSFFLLEAKVPTAALFTEALRSWEGAAGWPAWSLGNHDAVRFPTRFDAEDPARVKQLLALLLCLRGTPILYQGEELGLPQAEVPPAQAQDPFAGASRDGARTPMPWSAVGESAGFSTAARTWLPLDSTHRPLAADIQARDPGSVLNFVPRFLALRRSLPALRTGEAVLRPAPEGVLAFERVLGEERVLCLFELAGRAARQALSGGLLLPTGLEARLVENGVELPPYGAALVKL
jgi:alpha-glucosidase